MKTRVQNDSLFDGRSILPRCQKNARRNSRSCSSVISQKRTLVGTVFARSTFLLLPTYSFIADDVMIYVRPKMS